MSFNVQIVPIDCASGGLIGICLRGVRGAFDCIDPAVEGISDAGDKTFRSIRGGLNRVKTSLVIECAILKRNDTSREVFGLKGANASLGIGRMRLRKVGSALSCGGVKDGLRGYAFDIVKAVANAEGLEGTNTGLRISGVGLGQIGRALRCRGVENGLIGSPLGGVRCGLSSCDVGVVAGVVSLYGRKAGVEVLALKHANARLRICGMILSQVSSGLGGGSVNDGTSCHAFDIVEAVANVEGLKRANARLRISCVGLGKVSRALRCGGVKNSLVGSSLCGNNVGFDCVHAAFERVDGGLEVLVVLNAGPLGAGPELEKRIGLVEDQLPGKTGNRGLGDVFDSRVIDERSAHQ
jgi:hypothetical protein